MKNNVLVKVGMDIHVEFGIVFVTFLRVPRGHEHDWWEKDVSILKMGLYQIPLDNSILITLKNILESSNKIDTVMISYLLKSERSE